MPSTLTTPGNSYSLSLNENCTGTISVVNTTTGEAVEITDIVLNSNAAGSACTLTLASYIGKSYTGTGTYVIIVPEGYFYTDEDETKESAGTSCTFYIPLYELVLKSGAELLKETYVVLGE
ncbi:MAG: hypothetical protein LUC22_03650 [Prevotella sp.]|nr:hypothetical protein [Prevotella sp.]